MNRTAIIALLLSAIFFSGCATTRDMVPFQVTSEPSGAPVEVNGVQAGITPTQINLGTTKRWVGIFNAPDGWAYGGETYEVTAYPPPNNTAQKLTSQTKRISPSMTPEGGRIFFDLRLEPIRPTQPIEFK